MGFGVALVGIGAIVIGRHILIHANNFNAFKEIFSCLIGIIILLYCSGRFTPNWHRSHKS